MQPVLPAQFNRTHSTGTKHSDQFAQFYTHGILPDFLRGRHDPSRCCKIAPTGRGWHGEDVQFREYPCQTMRRDLRLPGLTGIGISRHFADCTVTVEFHDAARPMKSFMIGAVKSATTLRCSRLLNCGRSTRWDSVLPSTRSGGYLRSLRWSRSSPVTVIFASPFPFQATQIECVGEPPAGSPFHASL